MQVRVNVSTKNKKPRTTIVRVEQKGEKEIYHTNQKALTRLEQHTFRMLHIIFILFLLLD